MKWLPAALPPWFDRVAAAMDSRFAKVRPSDPVRLPSFANPSALPPASEWRFGSVIVEDIVGDLSNVVVPVFSDGAAWRRYDTLGAV